MPALLNRALALRAASLATGRGPETTAAQRRRIGASIRDACERADASVRAFTGWSSPPTPTPEVLNRIDWVAANLDSLTPFLERAAERLRMPRLAAPATTTAMSVQLGALFGYLSRRVIAQFDLLGRERLLFVGPNVVETERRARVDAEAFRTWVAIHEVTHRLQFGGVSWLRSEVEAMLDRTTTMLGPVVRNPVEVIRRVREGLAEGAALPALTDALLTDEQRALLARAQALMSAVEGHASFVMDRVGDEMIGDIAALRRAVEGSRPKGVGPERAFQRAIGLEAKRRQYTEGQAFFEAVAGALGVGGVNRVWDSPESLPTVDELREPAAWLDRVAGAGP